MAGLYETWTAAKQAVADASKKLDALGPLIGGAAGTSARKASAPTGERRRRGRPPAAKLKSMNDMVAFIAQQPEPVSYKVISDRAENPKSVNGWISRATTRGLITKTPENTYAAAPAPERAAA
jgi:hypothetical protein